MDAKRLVITRLLPKTGQVIEYQAGDDGTYEAGWWRGRLNVDNKTRFIVKTLDGDDVVIDLATGLMWVADGTSKGCNYQIAINWASAIGFALTLDFAGFTDWRIPNINELGSIIDWSKYSPSVDLAFFPHTMTADYVSSTTCRASTILAWGVIFLYGQYTIRIKTDSAYLRCVRGGL